ncbi:dTDP-4-dehydrorhamnose 3,5-epimerase [Bacteroidota bacterium]
MEITETGIRDLKIIRPRIFEDARGYFFESYNEGVLKDHGIHHKFVQDNQSSSNFGVIRGLHYQLEPEAQTKLVRVLEGNIWDVAVDLRENSPTFLQWRGAELSSENHLQLLIPKGFAHGFSVLSKTAVVLYKCDKLYAPEHEAGIIYNDPKIGVDWKIEPENRILSQRDLEMSALENAKMNFKFR